MDFPIVGGSNREVSVEFDAQYTLNYYVRYDPKGDKPLGLFPTPGTLTKIVLDGSNNPVRQLFSYSVSASTQSSFGLAFVANDVYKISSNLSSIPVGTLNSFGGYISVSNDNSQVFIVDGTKGYQYDIATQTIAAITDSNFTDTPLYGVYFNGFFVVCNVGGNQWQVSALNDCTTWPAGNFAELTYKADTFVGLGVVNSRLFLFGNYTIEVWYSVEGQQFPYAEDQNMVFEYGCASTASIGEGQGKLFWLANDRTGNVCVMMSDGSMPIAISNAAMNLALQRYNNINDAIGFPYEMDGHLFYQLTFPTEQETWLIDVTPNNGEIWCTNLQKLGGTQHIATCQTFFNNMHLIGSRLGPNIAQLSTIYKTNDGENILKSRISQHFMIGNNYDRIIADEIEVDFQGGSGNANNPGMIPVCFMSYSTDGGHTYSIPWREEIGRIGEYAWRANWYGLGICQGRVFTLRVDVYDPVDCSITGAAFRYRDCVG